MGSRSSIRSDALAWVHAAKPNPGGRSCVTCAFLARNPKAAEWFRIVIGEIKGGRCNPGLPNLCAALKARFGLDITPNTILNHIHRHEGLSALPR